MILGTVKTAKESKTDQLKDGIIWYKLSFSSRPRLRLLHLL